MKCWQCGKEIDCNAVECIYCHADQKRLATTTPVPAGVRVGDIVKFGSYEQDKFCGADPIEWRVLAVENGRALLLSKYALEAKPYHNTDIDITWEESDLRAWLNGTFYDIAFSSSERVSLVRTALTEVLRKAAVRALAALKETVSAMI